MADELKDEDGNPIKTEEPEPANPPAPGNEPEDDSGLEEEEWLDNRGGIKSVRAELKRKTEELAKLKTKPEKPPEKKPEISDEKDILSILSKHPRGSQAINHLKSIKLEDADIKALIELNDLIADAKVRQGTSKFTDKLAKEGLKENLETLSQDDKYKFVISKYAKPKDVEEFFKKENISKDFWDDPKTVEYAVKSIWFEKQGESEPELEPGEEKPPKFSENRPPAGGGGGGGASKAEVEEFAAAHGITIVNQATYDSAKKGLLAMKKAVAARLQETKK